MKAAEPKNDSQIAKLYVKTYDRTMWMKGRSPQKHRMPSRATAKRMETEIRQSMCALAFSAAGGVPTEDASRPSGESMLPQPHQQPASGGDNLAIFLDALKEGHMNGVRYSGAKEAGSSSSDEDDFAAYDHYEAPRSRYNPSATPSKSLLIRSSDDSTVGA